MVLNAILACFVFVLNADYMSKGNADYMSKGSEGETEEKTNKDMSYVYQEQRVQPCQLSSSIYYGGQDVYSHPQSTRGSGSNTMVIDYIYHFFLLLYPLMQHE